MIDNKLKNYILNRYEHLKFLFRFNRLVIHSILIFVKVFVLVDVTVQLQSCYPNFTDTFIEMNNVLQKLAFTYFDQTFLASKIVSPCDHCFYFMVK